MSCCIHGRDCNLLDERLDLDMEAQLEDYRRSLLIYNYEQALVEQKLDTAFSGFGQIQGLLRISTRTELRVEGRY
jgi:hypothetical protein